MLLLRLVVVAGQHPKRRFARIGFDVVHHFQSGSAFLVSSSVASSNAIVVRPQQRSQLTAGPGVRFDEAHQLMGAEIRWIHKKYSSNYLGQKKTKFKSKVTEFAGVGNDGHQWIGTATI